MLAATYTYSVKLALGTQGNERLRFHENLSDNSSKQYHALAVATHEGINRMIMQSDLRDVYHGVHITGFQPIEIKDDSGENFKGVMNDFYVQVGMISIKKIFGIVDKILQYIVITIREKIFRWENW